MRQALAPEIDQTARFAFGKQPIRRPDQLPGPVVTRSLSPEWRSNITDRWWATHYRGKLEARLHPLIRLRDRLLSFGGEQACVPAIEEDLDALLEHGQVWLAKGRLRKRGRPCQCHANSLQLWDENREKGLLPATGYALSPDGMWRQHSWCVIAKRTGGRIVETTEDRVLYYGIVFTPEEAEKRLDDYF